MVDKEYQVFRTVALLAVWSLGFAGGGVSGSCAPAKLTTPELQVQKPMPTPDDLQPNKPGELKVLAEGYQSSVKNAFVAVVRDAETYAKLIELDHNLPKLDAEFFKDNAVLAAFLGERNTGGYSVEITASPVDINVLERKPGKDMMVTQAITSPFKIVALPAIANAAVRVTPDDAWRRNMQSYRITSAKFTMTGGFAGRSEEFGLQGAVGVMREGKLVSFIFRITSSGGKRRLLMECSTGLSDGENKIEITRMSADSLVDPPSSGFAGTAIFRDKGKKLTLSLASRPSNISDGYQGQGTIEAELVGSEDKPSEDKP